MSAAAGDGVVGTNDAGDGSAVRFVVRLAARRGGRLVSTGSNFLNSVATRLGDSTINSPADCGGTAATFDGVVGSNDADDDGVGIGVLAWWYCWASTWRGLRGVDAGLKSGPDGLDAVSIVRLGTTRFGVGRGGVAGLDTLGGDTAGVVVGMDTSGIVGVGVTGTLGGLTLVCGTLLDC